MWPTAGEPGVNLPRRQIRLIVRADGTTIPWHRARSSCIRIRFGPPPRMLPPHLRHSHLHSGGILMQTRGRPMRPIGQPGHVPARYRPIQRCSVDRDTPPRQRPRSPSPPPAPPGPRPNAVPPPTTPPAPIPASPSPDAPRRRQTQAGRNRPLSRINWRATVAHHPSQDIDLPDSCRIWLLDDQGRLRSATRRVLPTVRAAPLFHGRESSTVEHLDVASARFRSRFVSSAGIAQTGC